MSETSRILLVEDEGDIAKVLTSILERDGYRVVWAKGGGEALSMATSHVPDLVLLDLGLPDLDGMQVLRGIRQWSELPVIVVSARQNERDKVEALDAGANDYITKPFGNSELLARIRTALRLQKQVSGRGGRGRYLFTAQGLELDYARHRVSVNGQKVHLTPIEYKIVMLLSRNAGKVLTHDHIIREVWGPYGTDSQVLRVNMANIRRKLEENPADPRYILTEMGVGYRMIDRDEG